MNISSIGKPPVRFDRPRHARQATKARGIDECKFFTSRKQDWQLTRPYGGRALVSRHGRLLRNRNSIDARNVRLQISHAGGRPNRRECDAMKSAILEQPGKFTVAERPVPAAAAGEVVVRIAATAVCHTDLAMYLGQHPGVRYPVVLGHEATGTIAAIAQDVKGLQLGQNVIINPVISCGRCDCCRRDDGHLCRNAGIIGREYEGSLSQYIRLGARYVHPLPPQLPLAEATIIETLATVRHAQARAAIAPEDTVVVLGQGTTGLLHTRLAVLAGAKQVIAVSRSQWKNDLALGMGARHAVQAGAEQAADEVQRLTGGGADAIIDTVGGANTLRAGIDMLRPGGRFISFSLNHEAFSGLSAFELYFKEITIIGARALTPVDMTPAIELVASGRIDVSPFITARYPLDRVAAAFEDYQANPGRVLRIVIDAGATASKTQIGWTAGLGIE
jgi:2-desacetyl-2-hydroxyethyl bacteriochlorophyllide A dehydrogenase